jgi:D-glycero-alpha-D-manno-heptose 1-phosphate guanylyltransferase
MRRLAQGARPNPMEAIVLAGGLGTRLAARLNGIPKPMAPVAGRPFLEILLKQLKGAGCDRVLLSVGHLHEVIEDGFGAVFNGMRVDYVIESAPLGTGGAIRAALAHANEDAVLVLNGDTFLQADYAAMMRFHAHEGAAMTIAITRQENIARYGGVVVDGKRIVGFEEKGRSGPGWINAGAYVLNRNLAWPAGLGERFSFELDFLMPEIGRLAPAGYAVDGFFLDIGVPEDLDRAQREFAER